MTEELEQLMKNLRLKRMPEVYAEQLKSAEKEDISYTEFLSRLLRAEWHSRQERALKARIKRARLPELWTLETFPYNKQPGINRRQSVRSRNWTSFRRRKILCSSARAAWAKPAWPAASC